MWKVLLGMPSLIPLFFFGGRIEGNDAGIRQLLVFPFASVKLL